MKKYVYSDMSSGMEISPTGTLKVLYDEDVILQSVRNIFSTISNERPRNPIGSSLIRMLFTPMTKESAREIRQLIKRSIEKYEPRVVIESITVIPEYEKNSYKIEVVMSIQQIQRRVTFRERLRTFI